MQKINGKRIYSATDIVNFLECEHLTRLDLINLDTPLPKEEESEEVQVFQNRGYAHENAFADILRQKYTSMVDISGQASGIEQMEEATISAMDSGTEIICQATLSNGPLLGHVDFLRRVPLPSKFGDYSYEAIDTKLARNIKTKFIIQLAFYSSLVSRAQEVEPQKMHVVFGDRTEAQLYYADYKYYFHTLLTRFMDFVQDQGQNTYPSPCAHCDYCYWRKLCEEQRFSDDHLSQVANITKLQIKKLHAAGITTLAALGTSKPGARVAKMSAVTLEKLISQASLQLQARETGQQKVEILPWQGGKRGFSRLPLPAAGDIFFDMEGDPLEEGGLEYLFGLYYYDDDKPVFKAFWAHNRNEERIAFEQFIDFITFHLKIHQDAHIYHYGHYEETALKRLMTMHGTREVEVDNLLRRGTLIDLYKVVREGIRVSEPQYSIKNLEHFYPVERTGEVTNAAASIVFYDKWKDTGDNRFLRDIEKYNFDDVRSTFELREWLITLRPEGIPWCHEIVELQPLMDIGMSPHEQRLEEYRQRLLAMLPNRRDEWDSGTFRRELAFHLLDFHRRAEKPLWWAMFARQEMEVDELVEDGECLGGLIMHLDYPPTPDKRSTVYTYSFPEQETKLKTSDAAVCVETMGNLSGLVIDEEEKLVTFKHVDKQGALGRDINIGPGKPYNTKKITEALFRYADDLIEVTDRYRAVNALLAAEEPCIAGHKPRTPIIDESKKLLPQLVSAVENLQESYLFIQGPPGSGKTYSGARVITALIEEGYRVGITSNSHKAIINLLEKVEEAAVENAISFKGVKKSTGGKPESAMAGRFIEDVYTNDEAMAPGYQLVAGTAWLFSDEGMDQTLDFLFVDEAGQVALANLAAMGTSARNIVLIGDQMQLGQPIQGVHPGRSGDSSLKYLLGDRATISSERGVFLKTTWRMHPAVCRFISDAVYDGRLEPEKDNVRQQLLLGPDAHPMLKPSGVRFYPVEHDGCSQKSEEEAEAVNELVQNLLKQQYQDKAGNIHRIMLENILIVAPYNMQVNLLKNVLPEKARVGTVDKFQGQEAEVVIISMATSSEEYMPRFISFLYSRNRLNVAISRARSLAILIANPLLMSIKCKKPEEMALVNMLCWVREYSESGVVGE